MGALQQIMLGSSAASAALTKNIADSFTLSDGCETFINSPALTKSIADSFTLTDAVTTSVDVNALLVDLISFWKLDEASGTRNDEIGSNHLTDNNTVTQTTGKIGNCAQFVVANNEWLSHTTNTDLEVGDIDWTFACWVNLGVITGYPGIASKSGDWGLYYSSGNARFQALIYDTGASANYAFFVGLTPSTDTWYFLVFGNNSATNELFISVNAQTIQSWSYGAAIPRSTSGDIRIGMDTADTRMTGLVDATGFWKRVLTQSEITALYNSGNGIEYPF